MHRNVPSIEAMKSKGEGNARGTSKLHPFVLLIVIEIMHAFTIAYLRVREVNVHVQMSWPFDVRSDGSLKRVCSIFRRPFVSHGCERLMADDRAVVLRSVW